MEIRVEDCCNCDEIEGYLYEVTLSFDSWLFVHNFVVKRENKKIVLMCPPLTMDDPGMGDAVEIFSESRKTEILWLINAYLENNGRFAFFDRNC